MAKLVDLDGLKYFYGKIKAMLALKADDSVVVKLVNGTRPDTSGNVSVDVGGGGVSTDTANTWTAAQTFGDVVFGGVEKYVMSTPNDGICKPTTSFSLTTTSATVLTIDLSELLKQADSNQSVVHFKIVVMCFADNCALKINGITYLYANKATMTKYMLLDGIVFKLYDTGYAYINTNALDLDLGDLS